MARVWCDEAAHDGSPAKGAQVVGPPRALEVVTGIFQTIWPCCGEADIAECEPFEAGLTDARPPHLGLRELQGNAERTYGNDFFQNVGQVFNYLFELFLKYSVTVLSGQSIQCTVFLD